MEATGVVGDLEELRVVSPPKDSPRDCHLVAAREGRLRKQEGYFVVCDYRVALCCYKQNTSNIPGLFEGCFFHY